MDAIISWIKDAGQAIVPVLVTFLTTVQGSQLISNLVSKVKQTSLFKSIERLIEMIQTSISNISDKIEQTNQRVDCIFDKINKTEIENGMLAEMLTMIVNNSTLSAEDKLKINQIKNAITTNVESANKYDELISENVKLKEELDVLKAKDEEAKATAEDLTIVEDLHTVKKIKNSVV